MSRTLGISGSFWNEFVLGPAFFQPTTVTQGGSRRALGSGRQSSVAPDCGPALAGYPLSTGAGVPTAHPGSSCVAGHTQPQVARAQRAAEDKRACRRPRPTPARLTPPCAGPAHRRPHAAPTPCPDLSPRRSWAAPIPGPRVPAQGTTRAALSGLESLSFLLQQQLRRD